MYCRAMWCWFAVAVFALAILSGQGAAQGDGQEGQQLQITASGVGTSEDAALKDAFSNAVQSAVGTMVDAETLVKDDAIVRDQVLTYSGAFIEKFDKVASEKRTDGLYEVQIKAQVRRKQLIEKLKAANVTVTEVKTQSLYARAVTQNKEEKDAKALLAKALADVDYPGCMLVARIAAEEPKLLKQNEQSATVEWPLEISIDEGVYFDKVLPKLREALGAVAKQTSTADTIVNGKSVSGKRLLDACEDLGRSPTGALRCQPQNTVGVVVQKNAAGDGLRVRPFALDKDAFAVFDRWLAASGAPPMLRVAWLDDGGNPVVEDELSLSAYTDKLDMSPYVQQNGAVQIRYGWGAPRSTDEGHELGPFVYASTGMGSVYCRGIRCSYTREVSLDDLKRITKMKCHFVSRMDGAAKP